MKPHRHPAPRSCRCQAVAAFRSCRRKTVAVAPLIRALASAPTFRALLGAATLLLTLLPSTLRAQSTNEPPPFLRTGPSLTQAPEGATPFVKNRWMDRNADGWDDLWLLISNMAAPTGKDLDKAQDTDGDSVSDYDEMLHWRDPRVKGPPLGWPNYTVEELLQAQIAAEAMRRTNEAAMARKREMLKRTRAVAVGDPLRQSHRSMGQAYRAGLAKAREKIERERPAKLQRLQRAKAEYEARRTPDGKTLEEAYGILFHDEVDGKPVLAELYNVASAQMIAVDKINLPESEGGLDLGLTGAGVLFGHFDGAKPLESHPEFNVDDNARLFYLDTDLTGGLPSAQHATHTAGTLASAGDADSGSKGMTQMAQVLSWKLEGDRTKMVDVFTNLVENELDTSDDFILSNHSYGLPAGWKKPATVGGLWSWQGNQWHDNNHWGEDGYFGGYSALPAGYDWFVQTVVYPLPVFAAGNDRLEGPPLDPAITRFFDTELNEISEITTLPNGTIGWSIYPPPPPDGGLLGWDCISTNASAKNVLTVGAVTEVGGQIVPTDFSAAGPTDDGRIKPDIVAKGLTIYSTSKTAADTPAYETMDGTSMAAPAACGALGLIVELYRTVYGAGAKLWASTMKGLAIHCADDVHNPGPDYRTGWGLLNARRMAEVVLADAAAGAHIFIKEVLLYDECEFAIKAIGPSTPVRVTVCWTDDPPGPYTPTMITNNPAPRLDADVDVRVHPASGAAHEPWVLSPINPDANATKGDNSLDNVEVVDFVPASAGEILTVRLTVNPATYGWSAWGKNRPVSIIVTGVEAPEPPPFKIVSTTQVSAAENLYAIEWPTVVGQYFRFETSTDLIAWSLAEGADGPTGDVCATHEMSSFELKAAAGEPRRFWRVRRIEPWDLTEPGFYVE